MHRGIRASALAVAFASVAAISPGLASAQTAPVVSPEVVHTGTAPTGYTVTFRISDPTATSMRIKGEWSFADAATIAVVSAPPNLPSNNPNPILPAQWKPGNFPLGSPNNAGANWPVNDMTKGADGVWTYTIPLPNGVFSYAFYRNCTGAAGTTTGCTAIADPVNKPWNMVGSAEPDSQVYVPFDAAFQTDDFSWQAPAAAGHQGSVSSILYPSPLSTNPVGSHYASIYLPPGYDASRAKPYPLYVLTHGGGGNEIDWSTQGDMGPIVDNLINSGRIQPAVIVMPNDNSYTGAGYASDVPNALVPYVTAHYNVSGAANDLAISGLSGGAAAVSPILFQNTAAFGYYGIWSIPSSVPAAGDPSYANPALKTLPGLEVVYGNQDIGANAGPNTSALQARLTAAGIPFRNFKINGGHNWAFWRQILRDFLTNVAFRATTTSVVASTGGVTATVANVTTEPTAPTGTVQFSAGGVNIGGPVALVNGKASVPVSSTNGGGAVVATYSGDALYNTSTASIPYQAIGGTVVGTVPATLSLTLGSAPTFGAFTPGVDKTYTTTSSADVVSTAGDATLSVSGPAYLANGSFSLADPLAVTFSKSTWSAPVSHDPVTINYSQHIGANQALRTGSYSTTLTFTLSTTTP